jgi:hypothetical protein
MVNIWKAKLILEEKCLALLNDSKPFDIMIFDVGNYEKVKAQLSGHTDRVNDLLQWNN